MTLAGARVVVTGSAGFVGAHLVRDLAAGGAFVTGVDRRPPPVDAPGAHLHLDLLAPVAAPILRDVLRHADIVFHLAARPGVRGEGPVIDAVRRRDNVAAIGPVLAWTPLAVPLVVTSSSSVYGGACIADGVVRPSFETDPVAARGGYARSKALLEAVCARRAAAGGVVAIARPFTVAGEGQRPDMAIARWLEAAAAGNRLTVFGSLTRARDVTDVADVVRGLLTLAERRVRGVVNLGTGRARSLAELLDAVAAAVARPVTVRVAPAGRSEPSLTLADTTRCRRLLGFRPHTDLELLVRRQWRAVQATYAQVA